MKRNKFTKQVLDDEVMGPFVEHFPGLTLASCPFCNGEGTENGCFCCKKKKKDE